MQLEGKRAIVTGAADGIGAAITESFVERGAKVLAVDLTGTALEDRHAKREGVSCLYQDVTEDNAPANILNKARLNLPHL